MMTCSMTLKSSPYLTNTGRDSVKSTLLTKLIEHGNEKYNKEICEKIADQIEQYCYESSHDGVDPQNPNHERVFGLYRSKVVFSSDRLTSAFFCHLDAGLVLEEVLKLPIHEFYDDLRKNVEVFKQLLNTKHHNAIHTYVCPKCKKRDQTYEERQTRSLDEGSTIICTCNQCGNRWQV